MLKTKKREKITVEQAKDEFFNWLERNYNYKLPTAYRKDVAFQEMVEKELNGLSFEISRFDRRTAVFSPSFKVVIENCQPCFYAL